MFAVTCEKNRFRMNLSRLGEAGQLDRIIERYIYFIKKHTIYLGPSKGPAGEDGKDVVAIENNDELSYCSYVIKAGHLNRKNLEGDFGILKQMRAAMTISLKDRRYHNKQRTVVVVHNGRVTNKSYHDRFIMEKEMLEDEMGVKLLRPIDRWDLDRIVEEIFPHAKELDVFEMQEVLKEKQCKQEQVNKEFIEEMESLAEHSRPEDIALAAKKHYNKIISIQQNYTFTFSPIGE